MDIREEGQQPERGNLRERLDKLIELQEAQLNRGDNKQKPPKHPFDRLPFGIRSGASRKITKQNYCLIFLIKDNLNIDIQFLPIDKELVYLPMQKTYHRVTANDILRYKNYPCIILPEWSLKPFSPQKEFLKTIENKEWASPQTVIIDAIKKSQLETHKKVSPALIIGIIVAIVVVIAIAISYKK